MGILSNLFGQSDAFYVRDFRNAYHLRPDVNPPRQKFQGYVNFVLNREIFRDLYPSGPVDNTTEFRTKISSLVRKFSLPEIDFKTEVKNQYNRKRIVNTGLEYTPVNITVMDTVGNEWYTLLMSYYAFYYMNPRNKNESGNRDVTSGMPTSEELNISSSFGKDPEGGIDNYKFNSNGYGFNTNKIPNFFERIDMILYHGNKGVQYSLMNPMLTALKTGDVDYSDGNVLEFELTFEYENFVPYYENNFELTTFDLNRFEPADSYTGEAFGVEGKPLTLESAQMASLGIQNVASADRTAQDQIAGNSPNNSIDPVSGNAVSPEGQASSTQSGANPVTQPAAGSVQSGGAQDLSATSSAAAAANIAPTTLDTVTVAGNRPTALPAIYGDAAQFSGQVDLTKSNQLWGEVFKSTVNNGLVAAINGGSIKDAVINTPVSGVVAQGVATSVNLRNAPSTPATNTAPTPTRPAPPPPATAASTTEPAPIRPGTGP